MGRPTERSDDRTPAGQAGQGPVHRAFLLLQLIVAADQPIGVRELARRSGLARSTVARLVATLAELGMVDRTSDGKAFAGPGLSTLSSVDTTAPSAIGQRLRPLVSEIADVFGESAAVGFDAGEHFLYLAAEPRLGAIQVPDPSGQGYPFHLVAPGIATMAYWEAGRLDAYQADGPERATDRSVVAKTPIRKRLRAVRRDGFAWAVEELELEVNGLAIPVIDRQGRCVAAVSLYGPAFRLSPDEQPRLGTELASFVAERVPYLL